MFGRLGEQVVSMVASPTPNSLSLSLSQLNADISFVQKNLRISNDHVCRPFHRAFKELAEGANRTRQVAPAHASRPHVRTVRFISVISGFPPTP